MLAILKHPLMNLDAYPQITTKTDMLNVLKLNITKMSFDELSLHLNPNLFSLHNLAEEECTYDAEGNFVWPQLLGLNYESIQEENGIYLLDDGIQIIIHFTYSIDRTQLRAIFGIDAPENIQLPIDEVIIQDNSLSIKCVLRKVVSLKRLEIYLLSADIGTPQTTLRSTYLFQGRVRSRRLSSTSV